MPSLPTTGPSNRDDRQGTSLGAVAVSPGGIRSHPSYSYSSSSTISRNSHGNQEEEDTILVNAQAVDEEAMFQQARDEARKEIIRGAAEVEFKIH